MDTPYFPPLNLKTFGTRQYQMVKCGCSGTQRLFVRNVYPFEGHGTHSSPKPKNFLITGTYRLSLAQYLTLSAFASSSFPSSINRKHPGCFSTHSFNFPQSRHFLFWPSPKNRPVSPVHRRVSSAEQRMSERNVSMQCRTCGHVQVWGVWKRN